MVGMLNEVRIFEASVFNSELDLNFINLKVDSRNSSQGDIQGVSFTARSYDLARLAARRPVGDIITSLLSRRHVECAADYSQTVTH